MSFMGLSPFCNHPRPVGHPLLNQEGDRGWYFIVYTISPTTISMALIPINGAMIPPTP